MKNHLFSEKANSAMNLLITLAWRNLWRRTRRTLILLLAIAFGIWSMLVFSAFSRGLIEQFINNSIDTLVGHLQIHAKGYLNNPVVEYTLSPPNDTLRALLQSAQIKAWAPRVRVPAVVSSARESLGVTLVGINPAQEQDLSFIAKSVTEGHYLTEADTNGILIGHKLAERLEIGLGKRIVVRSQDESNQIVERGFRIVGIFKTQLREIEMQFVFINFPVAQTMLGIGERISEIAILSENREQLDDLAKRLRQVVPELDVHSWTELNPLIEVMVNAFNGFLIIWFTVVFIAMAFGLVNTLLMAVFERTREIGLLQALGMKPRWIVGQILVESLFLLVIGLVVGNFMSGVALWLTADGLDLSRYAAGYELAGFSSRIYPTLHLLDILIANGMVVSLGLMASLYPAWRAARYVPVDAITRI